MKMHEDSRADIQRSSASSDNVAKLLPVAVPPSVKLEHLHRACLLATPIHSSTPTATRGMDSNYGPYPCLTALRIPEEVMRRTYESTELLRTESSTGEVNTKAGMDMEIEMEIETYVEAEELCRTLTGRSDNTPLRSSSLLENISFSPFMNFTPESDFKTPGSGTGQFIALNRITPYSKLGLLPIGCSGIDGIKVEHSLVGGGANDVTPIEIQKNGISDPASDDPGNSAVGWSQDPYSYGFTTSETE